MSKTWTAVKDPDEVKDYAINWEPLLGTDDTIAASAWSIADGDGSLQIDADSFTDTVATVWLSGGAVGNYEVLNRVTTTGGRTYDQTCKLRCRAK